MSDFGNMASGNAAVGPDATEDNRQDNPQYISEPIQPPPPATQEPPMNPTLYLTEQEQMDMNAISDAFDRARNAVIASSQLAKDVATLREVVEGLRQSVEGLQKDLAESRQRNAMLDEHITHARAQRDESRAEASGLRSELGNKSAQCERLSAKVAEQEGEITLFRGRCNSMLDDNDHFAKMVEELENERDGLKDKLAKIEAALKTVFTAPVSPGETPLPSGSQGNW